MTHEGFVMVAQRYFPDPQSIKTDTFEKARDRVFEMLREHNKYLEPTERWKSACWVFSDLIPLHREPQRTWAARILDEDLTKMLAALHSNGLAKEFESAWPDRWEVQIIDDRPSISLEPTVSDSIPG